MVLNPFDRFARDLDPSTRAAVVEACLAEANKRDAVLAEDFDDADSLRRLAGRIKQHTLDHLDGYLEQAEESLTAAGAEVHFAWDATSARRIIVEILRSAGARHVVKSKSMTTEEIDLNAFLEEHGIECVETDLGEFVVQIDGDRPSHIVKPIIHKNRREVALSFERHGLGDYDDDPETIARRARRFLREKFFAAQAGITGANFLSAESGRLVIVTNEGNARFSLAPVGLHVALVGIEKIVPKDRDLAVFLNLLARSATGQRLSVYTQFINGPRAASQPSGPGALHVVLLDNGRSQVLAGPCREILRCLRCGACQGVCPVFQQASGHAYRSVYGGPMGSVLSPLLAGEDFAGYADLPRASSLCGACHEVCPVAIPIPELLLRLRDRAKRERLPSPGYPSMGVWARVATSPRLWRWLLSISHLMNRLPARILPVRALRDWLSERALPEWRGGEFRRWWKKRGATARSKTS